MPTPEDDLKAMFVVLAPPPGGLTRFRARRDERRRAWPWMLSGAVATAMAVALALWLTPPPTPGRVAVDLAALRAGGLHPRWVGLGKVAAPDQPVTLAAARRVNTEDPAVVFYMLEEE